MLWEVSRCDAYGRDGRWSVEGLPILAATPQQVLPFALCAKRRHSCACMQTCRQAFTPTCLRTEHVCLCVCLCSRSHAQTFRIPEQSIHVPFLLVGHVTEPRVYFDRPAANFGKCLVGGARGHVLLSIINAEAMPFTVRGRARARACVCACSVRAYLYTCVRVCVHAAAAALLLLMLLLPLLLHPLPCHSTTLAAIEAHPQTCASCPLSFETFKFVTTQFAPDKRSNVAAPEPDGADLRLLPDPPATQFALDKSSYEATPEQMALTGGRPVVDFRPSSGTVPPQGSLSVEGLFSPYAEQAYNYNVMCKVRVAGRWGEAAWAWLGARHAVQAISCER